MAYQVELCKDFVRTQDPATWEEMLVITSISQEGVLCMPIVPEGSLVLR